MTDLRGSSESLSKIRKHMVAFYMLTSEGILLTLLQSVKDK